MYPGYWPVLYAVYYEGVVPRPIPRDICLLGVPRVDRDRPVPGAPDLRGAVRRVPAGPAGRAGLGRHAAGGGGGAATAAAGAGAARGVELWPHPPLPGRDTRPVHSSVRQLTGTGV